jgi:hypothetical protein
VGRNFFGNEIKKPTSTLLPEILRGGVGDKGHKDRLK